MLIFLVIVVMVVMWVVVVVMVLVITVALPILIVLLIMLVNDGCVGEGSKNIFGINGGALSNGRNGGIAIFDGGGDCGLLNFFFSLYTYL